ncbi:MAG: hypothetical protein ACX939_10475 [Hyphococcus sp.]
MQNAHTTETDRIRQGETRGVNRILILSTAGAAFLLAIAGLVYMT